MKIVRHAVNNHGAPDIFGHGKTVGQNRKIRSVAAKHQRRKITGVSWVGRVLRVVVASAFRKVFPAAAVSLVDMKTVKTGLGFGKAF